LLPRLPYLMLVPYFEDETVEALVALKVYPGGQFVAYGMDNYIGPLYTDLVALGYYLTHFDPAVPRALIVILNALMIGLTYVLARVLGLGRFASGLAALLLLTSPHHILINSHIAWSNSMIGFFTTAMLITLALAVKKNQPRWLLASGVLAGLAMHAHPVSAIMLFAVVVWFVLDRDARRFLKTKWPYLGVLLALAAESIVIINNLQTGFYGVAEAQSRAYIWQLSPTLETYLSNFGRLSLQLFRVAGGQLEGPEEFSVLIGLPLIFVAWLLIGVGYALRWRMKMPLIVVGVMIVVMPFVSNHYGTIITSRLTNHFTPLIAIMMAAAAQAIVVHQRKRSLQLVAAMAFGIATLYPLIPLIDYYQQRVAQGRTNAEFFPFAAAIRADSNGAPIYLSTTLSELRLGGSGNVGYVMDYLLGLDQLPHTTLSPAHILEYLIAQPGRALLVLNAQDVETLKPFVPMTMVTTEANDAARKRGYGLYLVAADARITRPDFVYASGAAPSPQHLIHANFENRIELVGIDLASTEYRLGSVIRLKVYWRALDRMNYVYTGFAHLIGSLNPATGNPVWGQDDHELGRGLYRTLIWQPGEVIAEEYVIPISADVPAGSYQLEVGAYDPNLMRLKHVNSTGNVIDDKVIVGEVEVAR
jgi:hypothetical protein